jgi:hypothetical protein
MRELSQATVRFDTVRHLLSTGENVKIGPQVLLRTMRNPKG